MSKETIINQFRLLSHGNEGIGSWITESSHPEIFSRLDAIENEPLSKVQFNQLLVLGSEAPVSDDFFQYYWLDLPISHPYPVEKVADYSSKWKNTHAIISLDHLKWGLNRLYIDGLLYFGNVRHAYRQMRAMTKEELEKYFSARRFDTAAIQARGPALPLHQIRRDDRYLISEMACKSYGDGTETSSDLKKALQEAFEVHNAMTGGKISVRSLLEGSTSGAYSNRKNEFLFSVDDVLDENVETWQDVDEKYTRIAEKFILARKAALLNTQFYLSMVSDLDVYVATSMRTRQDFRSMAAFCDDVFADGRLKELQLRYFDPTLSAASGHEDKGLIECLMVKSAKVLVYCAGEKESYGKDAEAAMALSLGKPVIFFCDQEQRSRFYKEIHPLSRLIEFRTGVAVGAMVTDSPEEVVLLLYRLFNNQMEYQFDQQKPGYLRLKEAMTGSVVRLQTNDRMLSEAFWNHYHNRDSTWRE